MSPQKDRQSAAETRVIDAHRRHQRIAQQLIEELDEITDVQRPIPKKEFGDDDSLVIKIDQAALAQKKLANS